MKKLLTAFYGILLSTCMFAQTCDIELLDMDWDNQTITLTLNDNVCSNTSTPNWVPDSDSVYVIQLYFSFDGYSCGLSSNNSTFSPNLGLNDTITYSFQDWSDPFNCFENAFDYYQETCMSTVSVVGVNNSINLDLNSSNNYIGFHPVWDNCYETVDVTEITNISKRVIGVYDFTGRFVQEDVFGLEPNKHYIIRYSDGTAEKIFLR